MSIRYFFSLIIGLFFLVGSMDTFAVIENIEWHNEGGQIFIERASYEQNTFDMPMCNGTRIKTCRLFFVPFTVGAPSPTAGVTIISSPNVTDTQYAAALTAFSGQTLPFSAESGLCIWLYQDAKGMTGVERKNCGPNGIPPTEPVRPSCTVLGGPVTIDFKELQISEVAGKSQSANLNVLCDANASIKVTILGYTSSTGIKLRDDGSLSADVTLRNTAGDVGITEVMSANTLKSIPVTAVLKTNGTLAGGAFSGSAIINIDVL